ncbi:CDP-alcohol phosphatidyltransferase family protein [Kineosporia sp. J2-2]|uniref:CDP-alcohol phosphatidyltransferase family protein n=1 Tax=Kineosporia corallincola TaxID=2835133 RepID=A0ABS5THB8_9ACTN|nr:CDP-alcohol phosphatidyltransferase family protein [Kineosporia corallincola]MBT0770487.1 CDP-alcohol phosphatidyltransferase family protein [Kineosporia corallincola]
MSATAAGVTISPAEAGLDVVFLVLHPNVPSRVDALRAALGEQGITVAREQIVTIGSPGGPEALARAVAGRPQAPGGAPVEGANAVPARPVALIPAELVVNGTALGAVLDHPRVRTGALASAVAGGDETYELLDVLKIDAADRPAAGGLIHDLDPAAPDDLLIELVRRLPGAGVTVQPVQIGGYLWARPADAEQADTAVRALAAVPERRVRLREAARGGDGFFSTFVLRKLSWRLTGPAERLGLTPNQVTAGSFVLGLVAAVLIASGDRLPAVIGALLLQLCVVVDCVDGELARYRRRFSRLGAWLDASTDRIKEFAVIFALAVAGARADQDLWPLAALAIGVQTFRSLADLSWSLRRAQLAGPVVPAPVSWVAPAEPVRVPRGFSSATDTFGVTGWLKRIGHFPIGERFLVISLGAALWTPKATLILLCVFGLGAAVYLLAALTSRARSLAGDLAAAVPADTGPWLGAVLQRLRGRSAVIAPAVVAVAETALVYLLSSAVEAQHGAAVMLVAVIAVAHYLQAYGVREGAGSAGLVIGADLRIVAFIVLIFLPGLLLPLDTEDWVTGGLWALTAVVAVTSAGTSLKSWIGAAR